MARDCGDTTGEDELDYFHLLQFFLFCYHSQGKALQGRALPLKTYSEEMRLALSSASDSRLTKPIRAYMQNWAATGLVSTS
jgi:hypothetical protein